MGTSLKSSLLHDAIQCTGRKVVTWLSWHRLSWLHHSARFRRMLELPMTAFLSHLKPAVFMQQAKNLRDFQLRHRS
jgi:hypothetical protein